jgi:hypothetical protein
LRQRTTPYNGSKGRIPVYPVLRYFIVFAINRQFIRRVEYVFTHRRNRIRKRYARQFRTSSKRVIVNRGYACG